MPLIQEPQAAAKNNTTKSVEHTARIRIKNRRKTYLDRHPSYFTSPDLELSDPLLYDRCIRKFQTAAEREADGRSKGYSGVLEADLHRSEAKLAALKGETIDGNQVQSFETSIPFVSYARGPNGEVLPEEVDEISESREEGLERWKYGMTLKFLRGEDPDFDYKDVDESNEWDDIENKEEEEKWFEDEEPQWAEEDLGVETIGGETGIQDF